MKHAWLASILLLGAVSTLEAQEGPQFDTRSELEVRRDSLVEVLGVLSADDPRLPVVERKVATIEQRLRIGDFRPGDMVGIEVRGDSTYSGNFPVQPDQTIELPDLEPIPLAGVLYSEAEDVIRGALATIFRNPIVELTTQMRIAVTGQVANPGFYDVQSSLLVSDIIELAGGPTQNADLEGLEIRRDGETIMSEENLATRAVTLGELGVMSGDVIEVPPQTDTFRTVRTVSILIGAVLSVIALISIF